MGVGPTMCSANRASVCRSSLPPLSQDRAAQQSRLYAEGHDEGMWHAAERVLGRWPGTAPRSR